MWKNFSNVVKTLMMGTGAVGGLVAVHSHQREAMERAQNTCIGKENTEFDALFDRINELDGYLATAPRCIKCPPKDGANQNADSSSVHDVPHAHPKNR